MPSGTGAAAIPSATNPPATALPTPLDYTRIALDFVEQTAYRVPLVDWAAVRAKAEQRACSLVQLHDLLARIDRNHALVQ